MSSSDTPPPDNHLPTNRPPIVTAEMLPERFRYLFDNIEEDILPLYDADRVLRELQGKVDQYNGSTAESEEREKKARADAALRQVAVNEARLRLKEAERELRYAEGEISSEKFIQAQLRRYLRNVRGKIAQREKLIMLVEAKRRLNSIGRTLRQNCSRFRSGGGFNILRIDGDHKVDGHERILHEGEEPSDVPSTTPTH